jgi:hypothetical protein
MPLPSFNMWTGLSAIVLCVTLILSELASELTSWYGAALRVWTANSTRHYAAETDPVALQLGDCRISRNTALSSELWIVCHINHIRPFERREGWRELPRLLEHVTHRVFLNYCSCKTSLRVLCTLGTQPHRGKVLWYESSVILRIVAIVFWKWNAVTCWWWHIIIWWYANSDTVWGHAFKWSFIHSIDPPWQTVPSDIEHVKNQMTDSTTIQNSVTSDTNLI